jgi:hypothetical protein
MAGSWRLYNQKCFNPQVLMSSTWDNLPFFRCFHHSHNCCLHSCGVRLAAAVSGQSSSFVNSGKSLKWLWLIESYCFFVCLFLFHGYIYISTSIIIIYFWIYIDSIMFLYRYSNMHIAYPWPRGNPRKPTTCFFFFQENIKLPDDITLRPDVLITLLVTCKK